MQEIVNLKNISIQRGNKWVLKDINWTINKGEHWFLMGNNGSGKTTLLEIMMGYLWPQEGQVTVLGEIFGETFLPDLRTKIGYVAPWIFKRLDPEIPVLDIVASGIDASIGYSSDVTGELKQHIQKLLEFFDCLELEHRTFGTLSSGQQLKVVLSRALICQPKLLILDEPFSALDLGARLHCYELLNKIAKEMPDLAVILVTHHLEDLNEFCRYGMILKDGQVFTKGRKEDVLTNTVFKGAFDLKQDVF